MSSTSTTRREVKPPNLEMRRRDQLPNVLRAVEQSFRASVPVYLVKRPVKHPFLRWLKFFGFDTYHWALRIDGKLYHLTTNGTRSTFVFTQKPIPGEQIKEEVEIGMTRMNDENVVNQANYLMKKLQREHGSYKTLSANCQDFASMLAIQIEPKDTTNGRLGNITGGD